MSATTYAKTISAKKTPQSEPIFGEDQVKNSAGGFVYAIDKWGQLRRFLILGNSGGSYYASERKMTLENAKVAIDCLKEDGPRAIATAIEISDGGKAPKNDPAIFLLALALCKGNAETKRAAIEAIPKICRIGTHVFQLASACNEMRGWGKTLKQAIASWHTSKSTKDLALQLAKYQQRDGWSHRDLLRLAHVKPSSEMVSKLFKWATNGDIDVSEFKGTDAAILYGMELAKTAGEGELLKIIETYRLPRETIPTEALKRPEVWEAMLPSMGMTAMIRNLATMTRIGLISASGKNDATNHIIKTITDQEALAKARMHPINVLSALMTYKGGHSLLGSSSWTPNRHIIDALDASFYASFKTVEPTGKRHMLALDVSGSMGGGMVGGIIGLSPRIASGAMAMVTLAAEDDVTTVGFSHELINLPLSNRQRLDDVVRTISGIPFGRTNCALPMIYASQHKIMVDTFIIYTDSETWVGNIHPVQALREYRKNFVPDAKLIVVGMVANGFTIADPKDAGMLDIVGFDSSAPALMSEFTMGKL